MVVAPGVRLDRKTVIVTGASAGIGLETTRELYRRGALVIMAVRSPSRGEAAKARLEADCAGNTGDGEPLGRLEVMIVDLASFESIRAFAKSFNETYERLDILVNNAGLLASVRAETADGMEMTFGVNHLGPFLLTLLLLDKLKTSTPSRIVNLSSRLEAFSVIKWDDLQMTQGYTVFKAYSHSKLANVLFTRHLATLLKDTKVTTSAVHPGYVRTEIGKDMPMVFKVLFSPFRLFAKTPVQGAQTPLHCALSPELAEVSGKYYSNCREEQPSAGARSDEDAARLWDVSCKLVGWTEQRMP